MAVFNRTIREMIAERLTEIRDSASLTPHRAADVLVELSSLGASLNQEINDAHFVYNQVKMAFLGQYKTANQAKIAAEASNEYKAYMDRVMQGKALEEAIRALKFFLKRAEVEEKESRY